MAADERRRLDRLILQARMADEEPEDPTPDDLGRVETALSETGFLDRPDRPDRIDSRLGQNAVFGGRLDAAVAANVRLVRHLMGTTADGMVPDLMAGDFRHGREGRAKTADFLAQLFARDPGSPGRNHPPLAKRPYESLY